MSDNHSKGIPPISGLGSEGSSLPPAPPTPAAWPSMPPATPSPATWSNRVFPVIPLIPQPTPMARRQDASLSEHQSTPAPVENDMFADDLLRRGNYPWNQPPLSATDFWQQQSSRAEVDDNPYSLAHVPRIGCPPQHAATPVIGTPAHSNFDVRQIAAYDRVGTALTESAIPQPRGLAQGFLSATPIRPSPGLTHPTLARPFPSPGSTHLNVAQSSPSPVTVRPSHPSPGHVRTTPRGYSELIVPVSPRPARSVPRRFHVKNVDTDTDPLLIIEATKLDQEFTSLIGPFTTDLNTSGQFHIGFEDLDEALKWMAMTDVAPPGWQVIPMSADTFEDATRLAFPMPADMDDVVIVTAYCGPKSPVNSLNVVDHMMPFLKLVGVVYSTLVLTPEQGDYPLMVRTYEVQVKFRHIRSALNAIRALNGIRNAVLVLEVMPPVAGSHFATTSKARHDYEANMRQPNWKGSTRRTPKTPAKTPGRGTNSGRRPPATPRTPFEQRGDQEHAIDLTKIAYGTDGRTTIMCRNIPNRMTWREFKAILDLSSAARYDYVYLRMDFGANQNVGYAFVNFVTPADITTFVRARAGRTWPGFERFTEKIAEVSYADVQGLATLIERFRNSPVMLNHPDNRPRRFHTSGPKTGAEAFFPLVSNFYTLSMGVYRSQVEAGLHGAITPTTTRKGGRPRLPAPAEDTPTNKVAGVQFHVYFNFIAIGALYTLPGRNAHFSPAEPAETPAKLWTPPFFLNFAPLRFSGPMDTQEVQAVHNVLHLIYHRNKNQHQRAKWWKWLSRLKRTAVDLGWQNASVAIPAAYNQYLSTHLIPRCYLAFSTVIAENQFSTLGIVLLATLSRFAKAMGIKIREETRHRPQNKNTQSAPPTEDRGERVSRADIGVVPSSEQEPEVSRKVSEKSTSDKASAIKKTKKAKKKKKNAIDDLFSGLL
ncbi:Meiosis protein mei2 [Penicillium rolfsii]|nr:Meiosis protein mei2 [Penicillium rolfsii]